MIKRPTVFVIGAGAGADIGMCMGEALMRAIARDVDIRFDISKKISGDNWIIEVLRVQARLNQRDANEFYAAGRSISKGITYAGSIDNYIHNHRKSELIKTVGKVAIVKNILHYEKASNLFIDPQSHPQRFRDPQSVEKSWLHSFLCMVGDGLVVGENLDDIFKNVAVVTFNYDRCLEHFLCRALQERFGIGAEKAIELVKSLDIHHAYGRIAPLNWQERDGLHFGGDPHNSHPDLVALSGNIRTYNEEVEDAILIDRMHERINWAEQLVFLGFHFHSQNVQLITPPMQEKRRAVKHAYATVINRHAPEQEIINSQMRTILQSSAREIATHLNGVGCREMFGIWGTTWTS